MVSWNDPPVKVRPHLPADQAGHDPAWHGLVIAGAMVLAIGLVLAVCFAGGLLAP